MISGICHLGIVINHQTLLTPKPRAIQKSMLSYYQSNEVTTSRLICLKPAKIFRFYARESYTIQATQPQMNLKMEDPSKHWPQGSKRNEMKPIPVQVLEGRVLVGLLQQGRPEDFSLRT